MYRSGACVANGAYHIRVGEGGAKEIVTPVGESSENLLAVNNYFLLHYNLVGSSL